MEPYWLHLIFIGVNIRPWLCNDVKND